PEDAARSVREMVAAFRRRRDLALGLMDELLPGMPYVRPMGAFYLFFRVDGVFSEAVPDAGAFCTRVLEESGVALVPGSAFGDDRYVRMSFATSDELLEEGVRRMAGVLSVA
ncbi:MAG TPA: aminotransferase class I/II-fold pyridoxal phosphate-dependent enzyme, partial [Longimicrobiales bacterium]|nr:aminotransferase class I/II-fold pyridoxal phosphate-dependent enzyme [Longimicrobiales bacterium]